MFALNCIMFYGSGGPYALFTEKYTSRALAKMSFEEKDLTGDTEGLGPFELDALQDWEYKFMGKYVTLILLKHMIETFDIDHENQSLKCLKRLRWSS